MNISAKKVAELIAEELEAANELHPPFASPHEGWAVILEEILEMQDEVDKINKHHESMFYNIMHDCSALEDAKAVEEHALWAACEAIQVAAMAKKFRDMEENI